MSLTCRDTGRAFIATTTKRYDDPTSPLIKWRAVSAVNNAIAQGKLKRPSECSSCGLNKKRIEGHHPDYNKPLEVVWLCKKCHCEEHVRLRKMRKLEDVLKRRNLLREGEEVEG